MGEMIAYNCRCGYKKTVNIGKGLKSFDTTNYACACLSCRELIRVEISDDADKNDSTCPVCGGRLIVYSDTDNILCPKCGTRNKAEPAGRWD